jgi:drug/metabolite transporter (DMT)-like permease
VAAQDDTATNATSGPLPRAPAATRPPPDIWKAMAWMSLALVGFTLTAVAGREAGRTVPSINMLFWRNAISLVLMLMWLHYNGIRLSSLTTQQPGWQISRALVHFGGQWAWMQALLMIPLVELFAIEFTSPLWVAVLAPFMLGEKLTRNRVIAALIGFVGILFVVRPGSATLNLGTVFAIACAILFAFNMIGTRFLTKKDSIDTIMMFMLVNHTILAFIIGFKTFAWPDLPTAGWLFMLGFMGLLAHFGFTRALTYADATVVAPLDFVRVPLIALIGVMFYHEPLAAMMLLGTAIIIVGNVVNLMGERKR